MRSMPLACAAIVFGASGWGAGLATGAHAQSDASASIRQSRSTAIVRASERVAPAVVTIAVRRSGAGGARRSVFGYARPRETQGFGSGFIMDPSGTVLTNEHVVEGASSIVVTLPDGRTFPGVVAGADAMTDVAVVRLEAPEGGLPAAPLGRSEGLLIGEWAIAIGNPFGGVLSNSEPTVTVGVVSATNRHIVPDEDDERFYLGMIQTDAAINPGNSGGPLVNALGEVIGINASIFSRSGGSDGLGFAIPIQRALRVAADLVEEGEVRRAWLGISVDAIQSDGLGRARGVRVSRVAPGSIAARSGIRPGQRLLSAAGRPLSTPLDFEAVRLDARVGDALVFEVEGRGAVELEARPLPSAAAPRIELIKDLDVISVTPAVRAERGLATTDGALVVEITDALSRATGLIEGDVVLAVNNRRVGSAEDAARELQRTLGSTRPFVLVFEREGRTVRTGWRWAR